MFLLSVFFGGEKKKNWGFNIFFDVSYHPIDQIKSGLEFIDSTES